jgi:hypothetical protein
MMVARLSINMSNPHIENVINPRIMKGKPEDEAGRQM